MNIKDMIIGIQKDFNLSYKEARFHLKIHLKSLYKDGLIDKRTWKDAKKILTEELQ